MPQQPRTVVAASPGKTAAVARRRVTGGSAPWARRAASSMGAAATACGAARDARAQQGPAIQARSEPACASRHVISSCAGAGAYDATRRRDPLKTADVAAVAAAPVLAPCAPGPVRNSARPRCRLHIPRQARRSAMVRSGPFEVQVCVAGVPVAEHVAPNGAVYVETVRLAHAAPRARRPPRRNEAQRGSSTS